MRKLARVATFGSDAIVVDLEDAVADAEKDAAREGVRDTLSTFPPGQVVAVRVNGTKTGRLEADLRACVSAALDAVVIPKVEDYNELARVDELLGALEKAAGLPRGKTKVLPLIETAAGLIRVEEIALSAPKRVITLIFGLGDFSVDIGVDLTKDSLELIYARSRIVVAARAAMLRAPIDGPYLDLTDCAGLLEDSKRSRQLGFQGRVAVHPKQVEPIQRAYSEISNTERLDSERIVDAFESAEKEGAASIQVAGQFVDYPIYHRAKEKLRLFKNLTNDV